MTIGASIFIIALGAILRFAVSDAIDGVDLEVIGLILMIAGAAGLLLEFFREGMSSRSRKTERVVERAGEPTEREEIRERRL